MFADSIIIGFIVIFFLRVGDVSLGTLRTVYTLQGRKLLATMIGLVEVFIFIYAISTVVSGIMDSQAGWPKYILMFAYAAGFAAGTYLGLFLEERFAMGFAQLRIISPHAGLQIAQGMWDEDFGATVVDGHGKAGDVDMVFSIVPRRHLEQCIGIARGIDEDCFINTSDSRRIFRGYMGHHGKRK